MSSTASVWIVIVSVGVGTYAIRAIFFLVARRLRDVPPAVREALRMIPPAALAALAIPAVLRPHAGSIDLVDARLVAGVVAVLVAWRTRSLGATIVTGLVVVTVLENVTGL